MSDANSTDATRATSLWGHSLPFERLDDTARAYLTAAPEHLPSVQWIWQEMDRVWDELGEHAGLHPYTPAFMRAYYSHPVWLLNGIFTASDPESIAHRIAIAAHVAGLAPSHVVDYGGGYGQLARALAARMPQARIDIADPHASALGQAAVADLPNVQFVADIDTCDVLIAQDVLEHVQHPVELAIELAGAVRSGGHLVFANSFWPHIKCHLPETFYLRHSFRYVMRGLGLEFTGSVAGAPHAEVFRRPARLNPRKCQARNQLARLAGPALNAFRTAGALLARQLPRRTDR